MEEAERLKESSSQKIKPKQNQTDAQALNNPRRGYQVATIVRDSPFRHSFLHTEEPPHTAAKREHKSLFFKPQTVNTHEETSKHLEDSSHSSKIYSMAKRAVAEKKARINAINPSHQEPLET